MMMHTPFLIHRSGLSIIYEDEALLALNKPSGLPSAPLKPEERNTALTLAIDYLPQLRCVKGYKAIEYGLVHRLDTGTSGLLLIAKSQTSFDWLQDLWKKRKVLKFYRAFASHFGQSPPLSPLPFRINWPIGHSARSSKKQIAILPGHTQSMKQVRGKIREAITHILDIQEVFPSDLTTPLEKKFSLWDVTLHIETGVMHQIRCHLAAQGCPIFGDLLYRGAPAKRLWLHAWKLEFPTQSGHLLHLEAPLPRGWTRPE